ncbi:hypothetical protein [Nitrospira sp. Ecomares 2.1]
MGSPPGPTPAERCRCPLAKYAGGPSLGLEESGECRQAAQADSARDRNASHRAGQPRPGGRVAPRARRTGRGGGFAYSSQETTPRTSAPISRKTAIGTSLCRRSHRTGIGVERRRAFASNRSSVTTCPRWETAHSSEWVGRARAKIGRKNQGDNVPRVPFLTAASLQQGAAGKTLNEPQATTPSHAHDAQGLPPNTQAGQGREVP